MPLVTRKLCNMGEPVRILDLAHTLIRLSGKSIGDVDIQFTGLRKGEKLVEELFYPTERIQSTSCDKIKRTTTQNVNWTDLHADLERLKSSLYIDGADPVLRVLRTLVPEANFDAAKVERMRPLVQRVGSHEVHLNGLRKIVADQRSLQRPTTHTLLMVSSKRSSFFNPPSFRRSAVGTFVASHKCN